MAEEHNSRVRASVKWFDKDGTYIDGASCETDRETPLHDLLAAWADRPLRAQIELEPAAPAEPEAGQDEGDHADEPEQQKPTTLADVRERLDAASAGPWYVYESDLVWSLHSGPLQILKAPKSGTPYAEYWPDAADAQLLRRAPEDIAFLIDLISTALERLYFLDGIADGLDELIGHPILAQTMRRAITAVRNGLTGEAPQNLETGDVSPFAPGGRYAAIARAVEVPAAPEALYRFGKDAVRDQPRTRRWRRR